MYLGRHESIHNQDRQNLKPMTYHTFMLLQGEKVRLEVDPNSINTVAVSLEDRSIIFAVAGAYEEKKLISMQKCIEEEKAIVSLMQIRDEIAAA